jgi:hypothetical protein
MLAALATAAGAASGGDLTTWLTSLGSFTAAGAIGYLAWRREAARADAERAAYAALVERVMVDVIPALQGSAAANREVLAVIQESEWRQAENRRNSPRP